MPVTLEALRTLLQRPDMMPVPPYVTQAYNPCPGPQWETSSDNLAARWFATAATILLRPSRVFGPSGPGCRVRASLLFMTIGLMLASFFSAVTSVMLYPEESSSMAVADAEEELLLGGVAVAIQVAAMVTCLPVVMVILNGGLWILCHLLLRTLGGGKSGLGATIRAGAYVLGATCVLWVVPVYGPLLGSVWYNLGFIMALSRVHHTSIFGSVAAVTAAQISIAAAFLALLLVASPYVATL